MTGVSVAGRAFEVQRGRAVHSPSYYVDSSVLVSHLNHRLGFVVPVHARSGDRTIALRKPPLLGLALLPTQVEAQERPGRMTMLEAGLVGGGSDACPGRYVGIWGRVDVPVALHGMVGTCRCADFAGSANRIGTCVRLARERWFVRTALWCAHHPPLRGGQGTLTLFQMGGYVSF